MCVYIYILVNRFLFCSFLTKTIFLGRRLQDVFIPMCNKNHTYLRDSNLKVNYLCLVIV